MKTNRIAFILLLAGLFFTGCVTTPVSGRKVKVTVDTTDATKVEAVLFETMTNAGFTVHSGSQIPCYLKGISATGGLLDQGNAEDPALASHASVVFDILPKKSRVRIVSWAYLLDETNRVPPAKWSADIKHLLLNVKADVESQALSSEIQEVYDQNRGRLGITFDGAGYIKQLLYDGPAARAGLKKNDQIVRVDGHRFSDRLLKQTQQLVGQPGTPVTVTVHRGKENIQVRIVRKTIQ